jgi:hypothetical protein
MAFYGVYDYSLKNFLLSLIFPITMIYFLIMGIKENIEERRYTEKERFNRFKKKRLKEYKNLILTKDGIKKRKTR